MLLLDGRNALTNFLQNASNHIGASVNLPPLAIFIDETPSRYLAAAEVSAREKFVAFTVLGFSVSFMRIHAPNFRTEISRLSDGGRVLAVFQKPFPAAVIDQLRGDLDFVDLDQISLDARYADHSAVSEAVLRLLSPLATSGRSFAVVGARGRFGSQIVRLLDELPVTVDGIDIGDPLERARDAEVVISAVGQPRLIGKAHLSASTLLAIDVGFSVLPGFPKLYCGDIDPHAYRIPRAITPVPGGVGPLQVATLIERALHVLGHQVPAWLPPTRALASLQV